MSGAGRSTPTPPPSPERARFRVSARRNAARRRASDSRVAGACRRSADEPTNAVNAASPDALGTRPARDTTRDAYRRAASPSGIKPPRGASNASSLTASRRSTNAISTERSEAAPPASAAPCNSAARRAAGRRVRNADAGSTRAREGFGSISARESISRPRFEPARDSSDAVARSTSSDGGGPWARASRSRGASRRRGGGVSGAPAGEFGANDDDTPGVGRVRRERRYSRGRVNSTGGGGAGETAETVDATVVVAVGWIRLRVGRAGSNPVVSLVVVAATETATGATLFGGFSPGAAPYPSAAVDASVDASDETSDETSDEREMTASNRRRGPAPRRRRRRRAAEGRELGLVRYADESAPGLVRVPATGARWGAICVSAGTSTGGGRVVVGGGARSGPGRGGRGGTGRCRAAVGGSVGASAATRGDAAANDESQCLRAGVEDRARCDGPGRSRSRRAWDRVVSGEWALQDRWRSASRTCEHSLTLGFDAREKRGDELAARLESLGGDGRGRGRTRRAVRRRVRQQPRRDGVQRHGRILREGSAKRGDGSASRGRKRRRVGEHGGRGQVP